MIAASFAPLLAEAAVRTTFQFGRIRAPEDWLLPIAATALVLAYVWWMYRRDARDLRLPIAAILVVLRTLAFLALLVVWLRPQWRKEEDVVTPSRVIALVDTSLSMAESATEGTPDRAASSGSDSAPAATGIPAGSRAAEALRVLESPQWNALRKTHEIHVIGFGGPQIRPLAVLPKLDEAAAAEEQAPAKVAPASPKAPDTPAFAKLIEPSDGETRMGEALTQALFQQRAAPVSGFVIFGDGGQNTGADPVEALARAQADRLPIPPLFPIGLGSSAPNKNVRVQDLAYPARTYPNDEFTVKAYVQSQGMEGRTVTVGLTWREVSASGEAIPTVPPLGEQSQQVTLPADGKPVGVEFNLKPTKVGRTTVQIALRNPPADDHNRNDNALDADVEITERRNRILLFASGASREYQFLRNQLQRILRSDGSKDKEFIVDVYLQTGSDGISQDSSEILPDFPDTAAQFQQYDCIIAFDPDWRRLAPEQLTLVKNWVENEAGGMILIAGRIYTDVTARDPNLAAVRSLYPVEFGRLFTAAGDAFSGSSEAWPLSFTAEGSKAEFLRLGDTESDAISAWDKFSGFYDYYPVKGVKDKSVVLVGLQDPRAGGKVGDDDGRPYLVVDRAVGAGRVLYIGGGEFWRLRAKNSAYFTRLYTQMVRHVAQARLLRDSKRGVVMVDHDNGRYVLNDVVEIRARLMDLQARPLKGEEVPLQVVAPDRSAFTVKLKADPSLAGNFRGVFPARQVGSYRLDVLLPDGDRDLPPRRLQVRVPNKESDDVRLNVALLERLAKQTQGRFYEGTGGLFATSAGAVPLPTLLADKTRTTPRLARPVSLWDNEWTLAIICSLLCLEWLIRRVVKLA